MAWRQVVRACWGLRFAALVLAGPALGLVVSATVFGLPAGLAPFAVATAVLALALLGILVRAELRRRPGACPKAR